MRTDYLEADRGIDAGLYHNHDHVTEDPAVQDLGAGLAYNAHHEDEVDAEPSEAQFATTLLAALASMAVRSKRRQADLAAALRRSGLVAEPAALSAALRHLQEIGCIEDLVPLYDGGVLMSVTSRGIEQLNSGPRWTMFDMPNFRRL